MNLQKKEWFNSIEIDFDIYTDDDVSFDNFDPSGFEDISEHFNEVFDFLPEQSWGVLMLAGPALETYGLSLKKIKEVFEGETMTELEKNLFEWTYKLTLYVMGYSIENSKNKKREFINKAVSVGLEFLDEKQTEMVISEITENYLKFTKTLKK